MSVVPFDFEGHVVRTIVPDDEPWFVLKDVCEVLGMTRTIADVKKRLDQADVGTTDIYSEARNRSYATTIVNESGLYDVILDSRKPQAKAFRRWVTSDVLPSIRKHGVYVTEEVAAETPDVLMARALLAAKDTLDKQEQRIADLEMSEAAALEAQERAEVANRVMKPKARGFDTFIRSKGAFDFNRVAKNLGIGRNKMLSELRRQGVLMSRGEVKNVPYQRYAHHFEITPYVYVNKWGTEISQYKVRVKPSGVGLIANKCAHLMEVV